MAWNISKLFWEEVDDKQEQKTSIHTPGAPISSWVHKLFGPVADEGFEEKEAYCSSLVWRAIKVLSEPMASMPVGVFEEKGNGDVVKVKNHPVEYLLNVEPSKYYSSYTWRDTQMHHLGITGNGYNRMIFRGNGELDEILMLDPHSIDDIFLMKNELRYKVNGIDKMLPSSQVLHFMGSSFNGFYGKNPIECHADTMILDRESRKYGKKFYQNGAFLSGILSSPKPLSEPAYHRIRNSWHAAYGGSENAGNVFVAEEGMDFKPIKLDPVSAAWLETRKDLAADVSRIYGVPLHMLSVMDRSTFNNIEHQSLEFVKYSLTPWVRRWEDEINRKVFGKYRGKLFARFDMNELLRGDLKSTVEYLTKHQINGNLSINEVRRKYLNLPGIEGGDEHLVQGNNMIPVKNIMDQGQQLQLELPQLTESE